MHPTCKFNKRIIRIIILMACFCTSGFLSSQTLMYDVHVMGSDVGDMSITRTVSGNKKTYLLESYTVVNYGLGKRRDYYSCKMEFENNILISSHMENKKNDKVIFFTHVTRVDDKGYKVHTEKGLSTIAGLIKYCCYDIFYKEPSAGEAIFSERWGKHGNIERKEDHVYKCTVAGCEDYTYYYENNKMTRMEVPTFIGKCKFIMK